MHLEMDQVELELVVEVLVDIFTDQENQSHLQVVQTLMEFIQYLLDLVVLDKEMGLLDIFQELQVQIQLLQQHQILRI